MATTIDAGNMVSARIYCWAEAGVSLNFDMVYLTPSPGKFDDVGVGAADRQSDPEASRWRHFLSSGSPPQNR